MRSPRAILLLAVAMNFGFLGMCDGGASVEDQLQDYQTECNGLDWSGTEIGQNCPDGTGGREDWRANGQCDCGCANFYDPECGDLEEIVADTRMCLSFDPTTTRLNRSDRSIASTVNWRREVGSDCGGVSYSGRCVSATELEFCEPNLESGGAMLVQVNCALGGTSMGCGVDIDLGVADCRPAAEINLNSEACNDDDFVQEGLCAGNNLIHCVGGQAQTTYCAPGEICGWDHINEKFDCRQAAELPCAQVEQEEYCAFDTITSGGQSFEVWKVRSCTDVLSNGLGKELDDCGEKSCAASGNDGQVGCVDQDDLDDRATCTPDRLGGHSPEGGGVSFDCGSLGLRCRLFQNHGSGVDDFFQNSPDDVWRAYCVNEVAENLDVSECEFRTN